MYRKVDVHLFLWRDIEFCCLDGYGTSGFFSFVLKINIKMFHESPLGMYSVFFSFFLVDGQSAWSVDLLRAPWMVMLVERF